MTQLESSKLDLLREQILNGQLSRRAVLKRAMAMGLSAPIIAGLLAACGGDDDDDGDDAPEATATTASSGQPTTAATEAAPEATATTAPDAAASPTEAEADATATTGSAQPVAPVEPGQGRGGGDLVRMLLVAGADDPQLPLRAG